MCYNTYKVWRFLIFMFYLNENCEVLLSNGAVIQISKVDENNLQLIPCSSNSSCDFNRLRKSLKDDCSMVTLVVTSEKRANPYSITCSTDVCFRLEDGSVVNILDCKKKDNLLTHDKSTVRVEKISEIKKNQKGYSLEGENLKGYCVTPLGVEVLVNN